MRKLAATHWLWAAAALFLAALALRLYRLGADPLWLDEVVTTHVARRDLLSIVINSRFDPHPPFYYLLVWLTSGFGAAQAEWVWRWPSALAGALSVPALFLLARRAAGTAPAWLVAAWLIISPIHVAFSQEARWPALAMLLAILLTLAFLNVLAQPTDRRHWAAYSLLALVSLFTSYSLLLVVGVQLPYIFWAVRRLRTAWRLRLPLVAGLTLVTLIGATTLPGIAREHAQSVPLTIDIILQSLSAGDLWRFPWAWPHTILSLLLAALAAVGVWHVRRSGLRWLGAYPVVQFVAPLLAYGFIVSPLWHIHLPVFEVRQFLVLLPGFLVLVAHGLAQVWARLPRLAAQAVWLVASLVVVVGSGYGLAVYWASTRSPEGQAAQSVAAQFAPDDALVLAVDSLSFYAIRFYLPHPPAYMVPTNAPADLRLAQLRPRPGHVDEPEAAETPLADVYAHPRLWLFSVSGVHDPVVARVLAGCQVATVTDFLPGPVRVQLLTGCVVPPTP